MAHKYAFRLSSFALLTLFSALSVFAQPTPPGPGANTNCTLASLIADLERTNYIFFTCSGTITFSNAIAINTDTTFEASTNLTLSGNNVTRLFSVSPGATLTLINITLSNGKGAKGGAINNQGIVVATNCVFKDNKAPGPSGTNGVPGKDDYPNGSNGGAGVAGISGLGGAIWSNGELYLGRCTFQNNSATGGNGGAGGKGGDAINNGFNSGDGGDGGIGAPGRGGAIFTSSHAEIIECVFENNSVTGGNGGAAGAPGVGGMDGEPGRAGSGSLATGAAIHNAAELIVHSSTFSDNRADAGDSANAAGHDQGDGNDGLPGAQAWGGGICNISSVEVVNSTFATNRVFGGDGGKGADGELKGGRGGDGGGAYGGNFYNNGTANLVNCTIAGGSAKGGTNGLGGAGIDPGNNGAIGGNFGGNIARVGGPLYIKNNIFARPGTGGNGSGAVVDFGYNLSSDATINLNGTGSYINKPPGMGHLQTNGGFGRTFALSSGSPAIDAGDPGDSPEFDQRGVGIFGGRRDIGAYEFAASSITVIVTNASGAPLALVQVVAGGVTNLTDANGTTTFPALPAGDYTVVPSHAQYTFEPPFEDVELSADASFVTFAALRTFSISGFVREGSVPIENVTVVAGDQNATTDTNGFYRIIGLNTGTYNVQPSSPGYGFVPSLQQVNLQTNVTNINFSAVGLFSISGRVRTESGQGLAGVTVRAGNRSAVTAPTGDYTITQVPSGLQIVTPSLGGYSFNPTSLPVTPTTDENGIDFTAYISFVVSGHVMNTTNTLGANAVTMTLRTNAPSSGPPAPGGSDAVILTDTNGFFAFTNVRAGNYVLTPSKPGNGFSPATNALILSSNVTGLRFDMFPAFNMSGRVTAAGVALPGAAITLRTNATTTNVLDRATTSDTGAYSFNNYPRANYVITPELQGYQFTPANRTVNLTVNTNNLDFASSGVFTIGGRVTKDTNGLANVTVRAGNTVTVTDADGNYALSNLAPGTHTVVATDVRYSMQPSSISIAVPPGQTNVNFQALEVYTINGEVTEGTLPLGGVTVYASGVTNTTGANGRYTLSRVPAGTNVIVSAARDGYEFMPTNQSVVLDGLKNGINFSARGRSFLSGRVIDSLTSNGITRIKITVANRYETFTTNGNYFLTNIGPGTLTVVPSQTNRGFIPALRQVLVPTNGVATNIDFVSFRSAKLFGRVIDEDISNGIPNVTIRAEGPVDVLGNPLDTNIVSTDSKGDYVFPTLPRGYYILTASRANLGFEPPSYAFDLGADAQRDFKSFSAFSINGRVLDADTLVGIPNIQVNVNIPGIGAVLTDATGNYTFTGLREGDYTVTPIVNRGYDATPKNRQLGLGPTNATGVTFILRGVLTLTGRVLEGTVGVSNIQIRLIGTNTPSLNRTATSDATGTFAFTNLPPGTITIQPVLTAGFTPTQYVLDPLTYTQQPVFSAAAMLTMTRATNTVKLTLRGLPQRLYAIQTNNGTATWRDYRAALLTDSNGVLDHFPSTNILSSPTLLFRSRR